MNKYSMRILDKNWLTDSPFDYELKKYKLLGAIQKLNAIIQGGELFSALVEVEEQLEDLYRLKNQKSEIDDRVRVLKGINIDTMSLEYEYPEEDEHILHIYKLCDFAIDEFESVFRLIRAKWRGYSSKLNITEIPHNMPTKKKGYLFVIDKETNIISYSYHNPPRIHGDWKDLKLIDENIEFKNITDMVNFIEIERNQNDENRFWRCDHKLSEDLDSCLLPIIRHSLYHKISQY